jgi:hypothetical protein
MSAAKDAQFRVTLHNLKGRSFFWEKGLDEMWQSERIFHFPFVIQSRASRNALSAASSSVFRFCF